MHLGMAECSIPKSVDASLDGRVLCTILGHCDLDLRPCFWNYHVQSIASLLFEVGLSHLFYGCIL